MKQAQSARSNGATNAEFGVTGIDMLPFPSRLKARSFDGFGAVDSCSARVRANKTEYTTETPGISR
jgi:hypothetical protein